MKNLKILALLTVIITLNLWASDEIPITVFHTNDLHSHLDGLKVPSGDSYEKRGGFARLTTLIAKIKNDKKDEITIGVDAGDFFAGTIFSAIALSNEKDFPEYQYFIENQYDLLTLGNHEFDPKNDGLEYMLNKMENNPRKIPLIASNIYTTDLSPLKKYIGNDKLIRPYLVKEFKSSKGNLRVGFLGVLGPDGCLVSRSTRGDVHFVGFDDHDSKQQLGKLVDHLNKMIQTLRQKEKVDIVILSMHGGGKESHELAAKLKGLDILVAGHTHNQEFAIVNGVVINQTGSYGENLGYLEFVFDSKAKKLRFLNAEGNHVITVTDKIQENLQWKTRVDHWRTKAFKLMGQGKTDPNEIVFIPKKSYVRSFAIPNPMGELITNAFRTELNEDIKQAGNIEDPVDAYFTSMGLVRTSFYKNTPYTRAEIFEAVSIGYDSNKQPGVDVVTFYLTPKEVKTIINFMEIYTYVSTSFSPAISSNLSFKIRKWGIPFVNRIYDIELDGKALSGYERPIKIATNKFVVLNIETVKKITRGWIDLQPKTKAGEPVLNYPVHPKEYQLLIEHFRKNPRLY
ncbi:MAG: bifunctional metallophosphatase/5'-nucleotidase [Bacteriovorax sp.]|nr:bifunctional metallophosphatase/5'-nucleotidase [Bacteriovorax sp.]